MWVFVDFSNFSGVLVDFGSASTSNLYWQQNKYKRSIEITSGTFLVSQNSREGLCSTGVENPGTGRTFCNL